MFSREIKLPLKPKQTFFIWGPRQSGKTTLLRQLYPNALWIDLLKNDELRRYKERPELLRLENENKRELIVIDEIQKVPELLDEVHGLIESEKKVFVLSGSSARKLKKGHANLLGGRALRFELFGLASKELGKKFDLVQLLNRGYLPNHYLSVKYRDLLNSYVSDYLKEEILDEGLVRKLPVFSTFLNVASFSDAEQVTFSTIAQECGVSYHTVQEYFQILVDTLLGRWLLPYRKKPKRKVVGSPKFYFFDVGVVNFLTKRNNIEPGSEMFGKAFENWVFHELCAYNSYSSSYAEFTFWKLTSGSEVDFIINHMDVAIEVKSSKKITNDHLKGLRNLIEDHPSVKKRIVVCMESKEWKTEDGITILPYAVFCEKLWGGDIF